ncbi:MAG: orotidine 5'-phosphate decarboxylase [Nitrososphaeria archaeon]|nr:orotidine 5'-phosphate decarboxylase [Nitrososphaeria archaeon]
MAFPERIKKASIEKGSRIVLGLDLKPDQPENLLTKALEILDKVKDDVCGIKVNLHLIIPLGFRELKAIVDRAHNFGLISIADLKLNDISSTNIVATSILWDIGFDAVICNPFVGFEEALGPCIESAHLLGKGVLTLTYMSHRGAVEGYGLDILIEGKTLKMYDLFIERAIRWNVDGLIVGATNPSIIKYVKDKVKTIPIFSPGVFVQGGDPKEAVRAGSDYLIIARAIIESNDIKKSAKEIKNITW